VFLNDLTLTDKEKRQEFREQSGWEKLAILGVPTEQLDKIKKKMQKINKRLPIAKL
jgi:DnaJ-domain-containing protein 1